MARAAELIDEPTEATLDRQEMLGLAFHLSSAAGCARDLGEWELACELLGAAEAQWEDVGVTPLTMIARQYGRDLEWAATEIPHWDREGPW